MLTVTSAEGKLLYRSALYDSINTFLSSESALASGRVDVLLGENEKLADAAISAIQTRAPSAVISPVTYLEVIKQGQGPIIMTEFINMSK